jgi:hypothetical protein
MKNSSNKMFSISLKENKRCAVLKSNIKLTGWLEKERL